MPTINVEMMKQLLQEFTEKEALTGEEIKVIEEQVLELEKRIEVCQHRLQNFNEDKDRLTVMMKRYVGNGTSSPIALVDRADINKAQSPSRPLDNVTSKKRVEQPAAKNETTQETESAVSTSEKTFKTAKSGNPVTTGSQVNADQNNILDTEPENKAETSNDTENSEAKNTSADGNDDAIKSINDALKGLFRK